MKLPSSAINRLHDDSDLSRGAAIGYLSAFILVMIYALYTNSPCLFFDWDGMVWAVVMDYFEQFSKSFTIAMVDPLQGMFDIYYLAYRGALPQVLVLKALGAGVSKTVSHAFYDAALTLSVYAVGRAVGFDRKVSLLSGFLLAALTLPLFSDVGYLDTISALSPNFTYVIAINTMVVALFWQIDGRSLTKTTVLSVAIFLLLLSAAWSFIFFFSIMAMVVMVMWLAALFAEREHSAVYAKLAAGGAIVVALIAAGIPNYLYDLGSSTAQQDFAELNRRARPPVGAPNYFLPISQLLTSWIPDMMGTKQQLIMTGGILGAVVVAMTATNRRLRVFACGYLVLVVFYMITSIVTNVYWSWFTGQVYAGTSLDRMIHFISTFGILFIALSVVAMAQFILAGVMMVPRFFWNLQSGTKSAPYDSQSMVASHRIAAYLVLLVALAVPAALAAANNPGFAQKRCTRPYFSPLERNAIIDYLQPRVALDLGKKFNGSVATFTGVHKPENLVWFDNITTDWNVWYRSGNDMRTIGLWQYRIPTLYQANITTTTQYYLTVTEFLAQPTDQQNRTFFGITQPNEKMMSLWGVRFVITDRPLSFGTQRLEMPIELTSPPLYSSPIRLHELAEPNLGNYSPTEIVNASDAKETLAVMKRPDFDGKLMVATDADLRGTFTPARDASMTLTDGGLLIQATSDGDSILVLPVQYSHCWVSEGQRPRDLQTNVTFFRANMMQLGVRFSGRLSTEIKYRFGPFWHSHCRLEDARDAERLNMVAARRLPP
jgi:hypothetical protein